MHDGGNWSATIRGTIVGEERVMTPWEADLKKIEALPARDRASLMRSKIIASAIVRVVISLASAGGVTAFFKWLS